MARGGGGSKSGGGGSKSGGGGSKSGGGGSKSGGGGSKSGGSGIKQTYVMRDSSGYNYHGQKAYGSDVRYDQHYGSCGMIDGTSTSGPLSKSQADRQEAYNIGYGNTFHGGLNYTRGNDAPSYYLGKADGGHYGSTAPSNAQPR